MGFLGPEINMLSRTALCYYSLYMTPSEYGGRVYVILAVRCDEWDARKIAVTMETGCLIDTMTVSV